MSDKQLILRTNWRYFYKQIIWGAILSPVLIGFFILLHVYYRIQKQTYVIHDDRIVDQNSGDSIPIDRIIEVKKMNRVNKSNGTLYDLELVSDSDTLTLVGIENASIIKETIDQLIAFKHELEESERKRNAVQVKQDPGSLERLNDLTGLLQEGLISYDDYLQERKNFEDKH